MPFTLAHSAIVLPLVRNRNFSATALIAGSFAPDFEYFLRMSVHGTHGHTLPGIFYFDIPLVIAMSLVFHQLVKKNLISNLPLFLQSRFQACLQLDFLSYLRTNWALFLASAIVGSFSHIFWDSFTHATGYFARSLAFSQHSFQFFNSPNYPFYYGLQLLSTMSGMIILVIYITLMKPSAARLTYPSIAYWAFIAMGTLLTIFVRFSVKSIDFNIGNFVVTAIAGLMWAVIAASFIRVPARQVIYNRE